MDYLEELNEKQREGVLETEGPTIIIAGAGSGKTKVLTTRIAYLIKEKGVDAFSIMALTFTNKAAKEMKKRIETICGTEALNIWMGTFHSLFAKILRIESEKIGYPHNFTIYDTEDSKTLIKNIIKEQNLDDKVYKPNSVYSRISHSKNNLIDWKIYQNDAYTTENDAKFGKPMMGKLYQMYSERCFKAQAMDFDDLLLNTYILFRDYPNTLEKYQNKFQYVLVDEFQDTNMCQYLIIKLLVDKYKNICVVGDDAQSIYSFRGATIENILNFNKDFPDTKIIKLEQNYRSTQNIVNIANSIIKKNVHQIHKEVWTENERGASIELIKAMTETEEGRLVASSVFETKMNNQYQNKEIAILYRTHSQSRVIEESLRKINVKYKVIGGISFYQRKEIKDLLAYFRFTLNTNDEQAMRRIINFPKRGIGDTTIDKIIVFAEEQGMSMWNAMESIQDIVNKKNADTISVFVNLIKLFRIKEKELDAYELAHYIAKNSGILRELYEDKTPEGITRAGNIQELLNGIKEFVENNENIDKSLSAFLQEVSLLTDADLKDEKNDDYVSLMTIHSAKGLEFKAVYIVGLEEELFPSALSMGKKEEIEEERRLFYVALTRAEKYLYLSYAQSRFSFGYSKHSEPSRFLKEIDQQYIKMYKPQYSNRIENNTITVASSVQNFGKNNFNTHDNRSIVNKINNTPPENFVYSDTSKLEAGMQVEHQKFGIGKVMKVESIGVERKTTILFEQYGEKTLILQFAKLKIL